MFVISLHGEKILIESCEGDNLFDLKQKIANNFGLNVYKQRLVCHGISLNDENSLSHYHITDSSIICVIEQILGGTQVYVITEDNKRITLEVLPTDKIIELKLKIQDKTGCCPEDQRLIFNSKTLIDNDNIQDSNIVENVSIYVIKRNKIKIVVSSNMRNHSILVYKDDTISDVKIKVQSKTSLPVGEFDLQFQGNRLTDEDMRLCDLDDDIQDNETFSVIAKLSGGSVLSYNTKSFTSRGQSDRKRSKKSTYGLCSDI